MEVKELKLKDVMCGDWVDVRNDASPNKPHIEKITPSHFLRDEHWYGVELVPEILEKNGFDVSEIPDYDDVEREVFYKAVCRCKDNRGCDVEIEYRTDRNEIHVISHDFKNVLPIRQVWTQIRFVHELQHLFVLLGIEKEVRL